MGLTLRFLLLLVVVATCSVVRRRGAIACVLLNLFTHLELCVHSSISLLVEQFPLADPFPRVRVGHVREIGDVPVEKVLD